VTFGCLTPMLCAFLGQAGQHVIHAACLSAGGDEPRAVLVCGPSGSGKTTAALAMAHGGLALMSDDATFIRRDDAGGLFLWGLPRPCKVHRRTFDLCPHLRDLPSRPAPTGEESVIDMSVLAADSPRLARPGVILLMDRRNDIEHRFTGVDKLTVLARLTRENVRSGDHYVQGPARDAFAAIAELVRAGRAYLLSVGPDLAGLAPAVLAILDERA